MQETSNKYAVGIDIGTTNVRCVVGHIDNSTGIPTVVGVGITPNSGMRKGVVINLSGPAQAIDEALGEAERMSGYQIDAAAISINGSHILSTHADGMIAVGSPNHEINQEDIARIEEVATLGKVPANREILEVVPHSYKLDGQDIKNPIGMTGTRLEIDAHVVSVLVPYLSNLQKTSEIAKVFPRSVTVAGIAAARAVLNENQIENGVALIDIGGATTNIAIYEEGDLQFSAVIPLGGVNITNDLAIGLRTDPEIAEKIKIEHASAVSRHESGSVNIKVNDESFDFKISEIDEIVEARLEEIFEAVNKELKRAGRAGKLPSGVVLTGGTAQLKGIAEYAKESLNLAVRIGKPSGYGGVADDIEKSQFATAVGLMLIDADTGGVTKRSSKNKTKKASSDRENILIRLINRFKT
ncbi:MAG TPA: cell division protein FtsA [Candidatus Saccharibacteria bacterium]|nr:cell division protein FtsA [Candidatus Saccharibacteria bacterium]